MLELSVSIAVLLSTVLALVFLCLPSQYQNEREDHAKTASVLSSKQVAAELKAGVSVQVVVLGDIGRSPRMQYQAVSLAKHGAQVQLVGYYDSSTIPEVSFNPRIEIVSLRPIPSSWQTNNKWLFLLLAPVKATFQLYTLWLTLGYSARPSKWMIVQNPPAIPTLAVAGLVCYLRHMQLAIDWHNFGYSILACKLGSAHPLVRASEWYERFFAPWATAHFCVSNAMARTLEEDWALKAPVLPLHDRPARHFQPIDPTERNSKLKSLLPSVASLAPVLKNKTRLVLSSTSWSADEDFSVLIEALCIYSEKALTTHPHLPEILVIVTGKGPQRQRYAAQIERLENDSKLEMTRIRTLWLDSITDYATLLACADLGLSLHTSSSGLDLPMKIVDMFGAGLPVLAWNGFEAWPELVTEGLNGRGFSTAQGLVEHLLDLFGGDWTKLARLKGGALAESKRRWDDEWDSVAGKYLGLT